jgi:hypothetical protein
MTDVCELRHAVPAQHFHKCRSGLSMSVLIANMNQVNQFTDFLFNMVFLILVFIHFDVNTKGISCSSRWFLTHRF